MPIVLVPDPQDPDGYQARCTVHGPGAHINEEVHPHDALASDQIWTRWCDYCMEDDFLRASPEAAHDLPQPPVSEKELPHD